ncbi:MAG: bifunctional DNA primase/polymerase [Gaiellaceae bacterium]
MAATAHATTETAAGDMLAAALTYAATGLAVFPVKPNSKEPATVNGFKSATTDAEQLRSWWERWPDANVGIRCGAESGIVVLDVDVQHGGAKTLAELEQRHGKLPWPHSLTGGGGNHYGFTHPGVEVRNSAGKLGPGLDVRGDGGYIVAPPSVHENGRRYKQLRSFAELDAMPSWFLADAKERTNGAAHVGETIAEGARDNTLTSLAGTMRRRGMGEAEILAALTVTNTERCRPPLTAADLERIAHSIASKAPAETAEPFVLVPVDWPLVIAQGVPTLEYVSSPDLPARKRIWVPGPAESGKSIWAAWQATVLTRAGYTVVYFSQENGLEEELRRFMRLRPNFEKLRLYIDQGLDLQLPEHTAAVIEVSQGAALVVFDTLSACWSGDEDSNKEIAAFDRDTLQPIVRTTGASTVTLDHTGNPQPFARRKGVSAPRGASAKGQKTDFLLEFRATGDAEFTIEQGKARGTRKQPPRTFRVIDLDDGGLDVIEVENSAGEKAATLADQLVDVILEAGELATKKLREAAKALQAGVDLQNAAMTLLENENPARVTVAWDVIETNKGRQRARVWRPAKAGL